MSARRRLLVTGFGAFPGAPQNPTQVLVEALARDPWIRRLRAQVVARVLPVTYATIDGWGDELDRIAPDAILHFGVHLRANELRIETLAENRAHPHRPDAAGQVGRSPLNPGGRPTLRANLPMARIHAALSATGLPTRYSTDAGGYLCNAVLYASLAWCGCGHGRAAGFVHVPDWPVDVLAPAVTAAVGAVLRA